MKGADPLVLLVAESANGPLLSKLAEAAGHVDPGCVEFFREGAYPPVPA